MKKNKATTLAILAAATTVLLALAACNSTPTVPVPPPEMCEASVPDADGICTVGCEPGATARNVALVYNTAWGVGVMQETEEDGAFSTELEADPGDTLVIQIKYGNRLSNEVAVTVPSE